MAMRSIRCLFLPMVLCGTFWSAAATIDLSDGWRFAPDIQDAGQKEQWFAPDFDDTHWTSIRPGERWEDQGFPGLDGWGWYRRPVDVPRAWRGKPTWLVLGALNDAGDLYCNGRFVARFGDLDTRSMADTAVVADLTDFVQYGKRNIIALRAFDYGASGGMWRLPCELTNDLGRACLGAIFHCHADGRAAKLRVSCDLAPLGETLSDITLQATVTSEGREEIHTSRRLHRQDGGLSGLIEVPMPDAAPGDLFMVAVHARCADGRPLGRAVLTHKVRWPKASAWPEPYQELRVLNNFVTELVPDVPLGSEEARFEFPNPRRGWVFIRVRGGRMPEALLDAEPDSLVWRIEQETGAREAMRFLAEGPHVLRVIGDPGATVTVRTVPELMFCYYPSTRHIEAYPQYDWDYMTRHVLPHVNTLVTRSEPAPGEFSEWIKEGRHWIGNAGLPGLGAEAPPKAEEVFTEWSAAPGVAQAGYAGLIVDEFLTASAAHYDAWGRAARMLHESPQMAGRTFYAWCGDIYGQSHGADFSRMLVDLGYAVSWERYQPEAPTEDRARDDFMKDVANRLERWRGKTPQIAANMVMCLGYLSAPPESLNMNPAVDYHAFMDLQFHWLANESAFWNLRGMMEYMAAYADEESIRFAHRLFRHYCIEGARERMCADPYRLPHLYNPDFADGLDGWTVEAARDGSIAARSMKGFGWLQGRYPRSAAGDSLCCLKRSALIPNRLGQTIKALEPGRLYSVKLISADFGDLHEKQTLALALSLDDADILPEHCFQYAYPSCYSHEEGPYTRDNPAHFNLHRVVFRPRSSSAVLTISDWASTEQPGGPAGQEIALNFVEVQPFHAP